MSQVLYTGILDINDTSERILNNNFIGIEKEKKGSYVIINKCMVRRVAAL